MRAASLPHYRHAQRHRLVLLAMLIALLVASLLASGAALGLETDAIAHDDARTVTPFRWA